MAWKTIEGYRYPYRISDQAEVQRQQPSGKWRTIKPYINQNQARVGLIRPDGGPGGPPPGDRERRIT